MESEDYPFFQGLVFLLENDVSSLGYELTFSTEVLIFFCLLKLHCNIHIIFSFFFFCAVVETVVMILRPNTVYELKS